MTQTTPTIPPHTLAIKFCGITNAMDAEIAASLGVDYLGLIFVQNTQRYVDISTAKTIINTIRQGTKSIPKIVGVFQNAPLDVMKHTIQEVDLDLIQCHGNESTDIIEQLGVPCIKVLTLNADLTLENFYKLATPYAQLSKSTLPFFILDLPKNDKTTDSLHQRLSTIAKTHEKLQQALHQKPYVLAGKITPEEIPQIVASWQPYGLDVASGIEQSPGKKDPHKMQQFMKIIQDISNTTI